MCNLKHKVKFIFGCYSVVVWLVVSCLVVIVEDSSFVGTYNAIVVWLVVYRVVVWLLVVVLLVGIVPGGTCC